MVFYGFEEAKLMLRSGDAIMLDSGVKCIFDRWVVAHEESKYGGQALYTLVADNCSENVTSGVFNLNTFRFLSDDEIADFAKKCEKVTLSLRRKRPSLNTINMENVETLEGQVLSIEQMKELESLGYDTSNASCIWHSLQTPDYKPIRWLPCFRGEDKQTIEVLRKEFPYTYQEGNIYYCYTLTDVINLLPEYIHCENWEYKLEIGKDYVSYVFHDMCDGEHSPLLATCDKGEPLILAGFEMLRMLKEEGYN